MPSTNVLTVDSIGRQFLSKGVHANPWVQAPCVKMCRPTYRLQSLHPSSNSLADSPLIFANSHRPTVPTYFR